MYNYESKPQAIKDLKKLSKNIQQRIIKKLDYYINSKQPLYFADHLIDYTIGQYHFRIGDYRVIFDLEDKKLIIFTLGHRKDVYR